jgi:UDP-N-acetylmuramoyl-tripeptide--D-alanyl-D-alanine ligase
MRSSLTRCHQWVAGSILTTNRIGANDVGDIMIEGVSTDSRTAPAGSLFVALRGENFDAHAFLHQVAARGVAAIVIDQATSAIDLAGLSLPMLRVPDTRIALGEIARGWRAKFAVPLIGVTGSNGKTTVKEMIASILQAAFGPVHSMATQGNFNNDIGVPLTLMRLDTSIRAAVVELGMNHPGEIAYLAALAQPTVGLVNNAQREHQEFMATVEAVAQENGAVIASLPDDGVAVFPAGDAHTDLWRDYAGAQGQRQIRTFGLSSDADVRCTYSPQPFGSDLQIEAAEGRFEVKLAAAGEHNVCNALAAAACALAIEIPIAAIISGLEAFAPVAGRLQRKTARSGALVIDDTYNANPDSVRAAIDVLAANAAPRVLVLGDMGEVGDHGQAFHQEIGAYALAKGIDHVLTLGQLAAATAEAFGASATHFTQIDALRQRLDSLATANVAVLVKGSRFMKMERVVHHLLGQPVQDAH